MAIEGLLIDLDGVLYVGDEGTPGAAGMLEVIREKNIPFRFVSNTTRKSRRTICRKLQGMGFSVAPEEIFTPAVAAIAWLAQQGAPRVHLVTTGDVDTEFLDAGYSPVDRDVEQVVVGDAGDNFSYARMNQAFRFVMDGAGIVALEKDRYWMAPDGLALSAGPFVQALEFATRKPALVMGKPSPEFFRLALEAVGLPAGRVAMIGDDIETDIGGAISCGMKGILVRTGKFRPEVTRASPVTPTAIIDTFAGLEKML
ncbi:HAD superfamily hydrolase (TIGR01458 family) [Methanolinea mesophila]|uniref:TIGR01458 family HAD-type hydrolase n=1 Tax=Methanolinea mesophila TaxID=547055 RepID=UPI001AEA2571|nr:TIGR01458 family HAD-type hydrolase [Methanolinea mesophila]MBP1928649.1 HAD superfamily hydrolase (TIGR01458 family) [Methanolinea mesophila]